MNIKINISEDEELRTYMKQQITQQVKAIIRGELSQMIRDYITEHANSRIISETKSLFNNAIKNKVDNAVMWPSKTITEAITAGIEKHFTDELFKSSINRAIDEKLARLIINN